jgi:hypothetical protein
LLAVDDDHQEQEAAPARGPCPACEYDHGPGECRAVALLPEGGPMDAHPEPLTLARADAYARGLAEGQHGWTGPDPRDRPTAREAREAVSNWTRAADDHAETSYYGAEGIQRMRAYWLGILRGTRSRADTRREAA